VEWMMQPYNSLRMQFKVCFNYSNYKCKTPVKKLVKNDGLEIKGKSQSKTVQKAMGIRPVARLIKTATSMPRIRMIARLVIIKTLLCI
jgi:hypothetical protein